MKALARAWSIFEIPSDLKDLFRIKFDLPNRKDRRHDIDPFITHLYIPSYMHHWKAFTALSIIVIIYLSIPKYPLIFSLSLSMFNAVAILPLLSPFVWMKSKKNNNMEFILFGPIVNWHVTNWQLNQLNILTYMCKLIEQRTTIKNEIFVRPLKSESKNLFFCFSVNLNTFPFIECWSCVSPKHKIKEKLPKGE